MDQNFLNLLLKNIDEVKNEIKGLRNNEIALLNKKMDEIAGYKNRIWGGAAVLSFIVSIVVAIGLKFIN